MSKAAMTADEALTAYFRHVEDLKAFFVNRRHFASFPWHKALAKSSYKCGTNERDEQGRALRSTCKALKKWGASGPGLGMVSDARTRAGATLLLKLVALTERADAEHAEVRQGKCYFEWDYAGGERWRSEHDQGLRQAYELLNAWARGEDVTLLKLAAE